MALVRRGPRSGRATGSGRLDQAKRQHQRGEANDRVSARLHLRGHRPATGSLCRGFAPARGRACGGGAPRSVRVVSRAFRAPPLERWGRRGINGVGDDVVTERVVAFAGSLRRGSFNRALLHAAMELAPDGMTIEPIEIGAMPFYDAD